MSKSEETKELFDGTDNSCKLLLEERIKVLKENIKRTQENKNKLEDEISITTNNLLIMQGGLIFASRLFKDLTEKGQEKK